MLADWYFTSCLRYSPRATSTLLDLFGALDAVDPQKSILALRELDRAEIWPRIYALPRILRNARQSSSEGLRRAANDFIAGHDFSLPSARNEELRTVAAQPQDCFVRTVGHTVRAVLRDHHLSRREISLPVMPSGGARVSDADYVSEGRTFLVKDPDAGWMADFRAVPPMSVDDLFAHYQSSLDVGIDQRIEPKAFHFVGPARGDDSALPAWIFEFGFGYTLRVDQAQLRHNGGECNLGGVLFLGDRIRALRFVREEGDQLFLDLIDYALGSADSTLLFRQAKKRVVHVLRLRHDETGPHIVSIEGCDERYLRTTAAFTVSRARLERRSEATETGSAPRESEEVVYGRLDIGAFERSDGEEVIFRAVRLVFHAPDGIHSNDILFLKADGIETTYSGNDVFVRFRPLPGIAPADVGADFRAGVQVHRRQFSGRPALLWRHLKKDPRAIRDVFPVHVVAPERSGHVDCSIMKGIPNRHVAALRDYLRFTDRDRPAFGVVLRSTDDHDARGVHRRGLRIEFRPGIFFFLPDEDLAGGSANLREGTSVRIALDPASPSPFFLLPCGYGDEVYVGSNRPRPVVALPTDRLTKRVNDPGIHNFRWWDPPPAGCTFSIGDLPDLLCELVDGRQERLGPHANDAIAFMERGHPKIAWCIRREDGRMAIYPEEGDSPVGRIVLHEDGRAFFAALDGDPADARELDWTVLTYADLPVRDVQARIRERRWLYHDRTTGVWRDGKALRPEVAVCSGLTGPLFFSQEHRSPQLRLRHWPEWLHSFGFPMREPVDLLGPDDITLTVAGYAKVDGEISGLWLEHTPGRVVHLPAEMLCWRSRQQGHMPERIDWLHFAPGDEITLRAVEGHVMSSDLVKVIAWRRGPRACFGVAEALLPVMAADAENGGLTLGNGRFRLTLPTSQPPPEGSAWWLTRENGLTPFDGAIRPRSVVLLGIDQSTNRVIVHGSGGCTAEPARFSRAQSAHPFDQMIFRPDGHTLDWAGLNLLIRSVGGALPATVVSFDAGARRVYFSFAEQQASLRPAHLGRATALGWLPGGTCFEEDQLVLWLGQGFICRPFREIISGVPVERRREVAEDFVRGGGEVWLRADEKGKIHVGLGQEPSTGEINVSAEAFAGPMDSVRYWGMIARSEESARLFWIPAVCLAWCELTRQEAEPYFLKRQRTLRAAKRRGYEGDIFLSLVETREALAEAEVLVPGVATRVFVHESDVPANPGERRFLAETQSAGILMRFVWQEDQRYLPGDLEAVEIERRRGRVGYARDPLLLTVVSKGFRRIPLMLPVSWTGGANRHPSFQTM